jgi:hypothetical protein
MNRRPTAKLVTILVLGGAVAIVVARNSGWRPARLTDAVVPAPKAEPTPQDAVYAMLDAARDGNVTKYLGAYTGHMLVSLQRTVAESGDARFAVQLKESNAPIKGVAINEPETLTDREVKLRVEYVYQDRNEAQQMYLERTEAGWKIARVDAAERVKTLVPYGTPVQ